MGIFFAETDSHTTHTNVVEDGDVQKPNTNNTEDDGCSNSTVVPTEARRCLCANANHTRTQSAGQDRSTRRETVRIARCSNRNKPPTRAVCGTLALRNASQPRRSRSVRARVCVCACILKPVCALPLYYAVWGAPAPPF